MLYARAMQERRKTPYASRLWTRAFGRHKRRFQPSNRVFRLSTVETRSGATCAGTDFHRKCGLLGHSWSPKYLKPSFSVRTRAQGLGAAGPGSAAGFFGAGAVNSLGRLQIPPISARIASSSYSSQISTILPSVIWKKSISGPWMILGGPLADGVVVKGKSTAL